MRTYSTAQQLLCHGGYCGLILSLARTSCRLLFTARPTARLLAGNPLRDVVRSRNPSKSTLAPTVVLQKHHQIIRVSAGLIQFVYRSHLRLATEATRNRNAFSPFSARVSFQYQKTQHQRHQSETSHLHKVSQKYGFQILLDYFLYSNHFNFNIMCTMFDSHTHFLFLLHYREPIEFTTELLTISYELIKHQSNLLVLRRDTVPTFRLSPFQICPFSPSTKSDCQ